MSFWNLKYKLDSSAGYSELRAQENRTFNLTFLNGDLVNNSKSSQSGISARAFKNGRWGFSSNPQIDVASAERVLSTARANAEFLSRKNPGHEGLSKIKGVSGNLDLSTKKTKLTSAELTGFLREVDGYIKTKYPELKTRTINMYQQDFIKEGYNTENASTFLHYARSFVAVRLGMDSASGPVDRMYVFGDKGQIEDTLPSMEEVKEKLEDTYKQLKDKVNGVYAEAGYKDVILHSKLAGILAHEAIGHTTEADLVRGGSVAKEWLNQSVASPLVNLVDFAHTAYGQSLPSPVYFDDEGTAAEDTVIIENGILKNFMHNKETAALFNHKATGHARAWAFNDEPLIRMRNTAILPGKSSIDEMIASVDDGYFLVDHSNGQADSTSEFMFGVTFGYEIKKGKLGRAILDTTIAGVAFDMLKTVDMVSDEMEWRGYGTCGKKQPMFVGMGGPAVKCKINIGGK